eukprot:2924337-Lingulodinium_polyedra.AAC.1
MAMAPMANRASREAARSQHRPRRCFPKKYVDPNWSACLLHVSQQSADAVLHSDFEFGELRMRNRR